MQIYDCVGADVGSLTDASLSFSGLSVGDDPITYSYTTPSGFSSGIADNSCSAGSASIFSVPSPPAVPINFNYSYIWTADPPFTIPNNTTSLNILLNPGPTIDTQFTLELLGTNPGAVCGGTSSDTELFDYIQPGESMIEPVAPSYCEQELPFNLISDQPSGTWSGAGITNSNLGTFSPAVSGAGTWTVTFMPSTACVNSSTIDIMVVEQPVASITGIPVLCSSAAPFDLVADYPGGIWTGTGITDSIMGTFDPAIAATEGTVAINYYIDGACPIQGNTDINVVEQEPLQLNTPQDVLCIDGTSINLTANIPNGTWTGTGITEQAFGLFDPAIAGLGSWSITYTYNEVCFDESQITIEVIDSSLVLTAQPLLCVTSDPVNLEASYPGGIWSGNGITDPSGGLFDPASIGAAGSYTVYYFSNNACNAVDSMSIELQGVPSVSITIPASVCEEALTLNLDADVDGGTWSGDGIIDATTGLFDPGAAGAGPAVITYTLAGICESTDSGTIQVNPTPALNAGNDVAICYNESVSMNATGASIYSWSPLSGLSSGAVPNPVADPNNTTTYTVTGFSSFGCSAQDQVLVTVYPEPNVIVNGPFTVCQGDVVQLQASGMDSYIWTGSGISSNLISNPTATPTETTTYTVIGQDSNGCDGSATIVVNVTQPVSYFVASTYEGMSPLEVTFDNNSVGDSFEWNFGNGSTLNTTDPNLNPTEEFVGEGTYTVTLTTIENGCPEDYSVNIFVFYDSALLTVPNVVTMNGDSQNDNFEISTRNMRTMDVQIFDRWGKNLGSIDRPNGFWSPREFGTGTYYFVLKAEGYDNEKYDQAGFFTVLE